MAQLASDAIDPRHLHYFAALAEEPHFARAAACPGNAQPALARLAPSCGIIAA